APRVDDDLGPASFSRREAENVSGQQLLATAAFTPDQDVGPQWRDPPGRPERAEQGQGVADVLPTLVWDQPVLPDAVAKLVRSVGLVAVEKGERPELREPPADLVARLAREDDDGKVGV